MGYTVTVDKDLCLSSSRCVLDEPDAFRFDHDELAEPTETAGSLPADRLVAAARACPSGAIRLHGDGAPTDLD